MYIDTENPPSDNGGGLLGGLTSGSNGGNGGISPVLIGVGILAAVLLIR